MEGKKSLHGKCGILRCGGIELWRDNVDSYGIGRTIFEDWFYFDLSNRCMYPMTREDEISLFWSLLLIKKISNIICERSMKKFDYNLSIQLRSEIDDSIIYSYDLPYKIRVFRLSCPYFVSLLKKENDEIIKTVNVSPLNGDVLDEMKGGVQDE